MFQGMTEDAYQFFWDIAFHNEHAFFEENRERYKKSGCRVTLQPPGIGVDQGSVSVKGIYQPSPKILHQPTHRIVQGLHDSAVTGAALRCIRTIHAAVCPRCRSCSEPGPIR